MDATPRIRPPAVSGRFYPEDPSGLRRLIAACFDRARTGPSEPAPKALLVPHAGYVYSGPVAASAYHRLEPRGTGQRVILIGPSHFVSFRGFALSGADAFETPLGRVAVDAAAATSALELPGTQLLDEAHRQEHSLEVQLPFLQSILAEFTILPILVGKAAPEAVARTILSLSRADATLFIVSSDLSHYHDYATALRIDAETCRAIGRLEAERLAPARACGWSAIGGLLLAARQLRLQPTCLDCRNSGDTAGGRQSVVGYAAFSFSEPRAA